MTQIRLVAGYGSMVALEDFEAAERERNDWKRKYLDCNEQGDRLLSASQANVRKWKAERGQAEALAVALQDVIEQPFSEKYLDFARIALVTYRRALADEPKASAG